jgi:Ca-activated chloride channel homolog
MIWSEFSQFHFIRPLWLWGIPALFFLWLLLTRLRRVTLWEAFIPKDKLAVLQIGRGRHSKSWRRLLGAAWMLAIIGTAGPSWRQIEVPTIRNESAMVILLDLSQSMLAQDLTPNRLTRAKYKLIDLLRTRTDGQTALVVYAGDAHTVTPLTDDAATIEVLLPALHPAIMPIAGSNAEAAVALAQQLLHDGGTASGRIIMLTDGIAKQASDAITRELSATHSLSILGIASMDPVPIPNESGGFVRDAAGEIVLVDFDRPAMRALAQRQNGRFVDIQTDESDIVALTSDLGQVTDTAESNVVYDSWEDIGYWIVLLILPFAAFSFRKGVFFLLPLTLFSMISPQPAYALEWGDLGWKDLAWEKLWKTPDQRGAQLLDQGDTQAAANAFERSDWAGVANYRAGDYNQAAELFSSVEGAVAQYNLANALAFAGELEQAIEAYDKALASDPTMEDAQYNKAILEELLQQQQEQQQEQQQNQQGENQQDQQDNQGQQQPQQQTQNSDEQSEQAQNEENQGDQSQSENDEQRNEQETADAEQDSQEQNQEQELETQMAEATPDELDESSERWLRSIPDDPSGFLRRKFEYESARRQQEQRSTPYTQPPGTERY